MNAAVRSVWKDEVSVNSQTSSVGSLAENTSISIDYQQLYSTEKNSASLLHLGGEKALNLL